VCPRAAGARQMVLELKGLDPTGTVSGRARSWPAAQAHPTRAGRSLRACAAGDRRPPGFPLSRCRRPSTCPCRGRLGQRCPGGSPAGQRRVHCLRVQLAWGSPPGSGVTANHRGSQPSAIRTCYRVLPPRNSHSYKHSITSLKLRIGAAILWAAWRSTPESSASQGVERKPIGESSARQGEWACRREIAAARLRRREIRAPQAPP